MATKLPITGNFRVTCEYKRKGNWKAGWHTGIDIVSENKTIYSASVGKVLKTGYDKSYGNYIVIKGSCNNFFWYCHLSKIYVKPNTPVNFTTKIGVMGNTGNSTGTHLHFEIRDKSNLYGKTVNPANYMGIPNKVGSYNSNNYQITDTKKDYEKIAKEIINGKYGNGQTRINNLKKLGYSDTEIKEIQNKVNQLLK